MRRIISIFAVLCAALFSAGAWSAVNVGIFTDETEARNAMAASVGSTGPCSLTNAGTWPSTACYGFSVPPMTRLWGSCDNYVNGEWKPTACAVVVTSCPAGTENINGQCRPVCVDPEVRNASGVCEDKCKSKENQDQGSFTISSDPSGGFCYQGCAIAVAGTPTTNADGSKTYPESIGLGRSCVVGTADPSGNPYADPTAPPSGSGGGGGGTTGTCANGGTDYPTCTPPSGTGTCANGGTDYPTCTAPSGTGTCANGGTDYPTCTAPSGSGTGTCANGGTNYPTCTAPGGVGGGNCGGAGQDPCNVNLTAPTNYNELKDATWDTATSQALTDAWSSLLSGLSTRAFNDGAVSAQEEFANKLVDWFDPIPSSGCTPFRIQAGFIDYTWDHCAKVELVSGVLGYALWFYLLIGTLNQLTGRKVTE